MNDSDIEEMFKEKKPPKPQDSDSQEGFPATTKYFMCVMKGPKSVWHSHDSNWQADKQYLAW